VCERRGNPIQPNGIGNKALQVKVDLRQVVHLCDSGKISIAINNMIGEIGDIQINIVMSYVEAVGSVLGVCKNGKQKTRKNQSDFFHRQMV
jgi:hypothetical protein